jgi:hypothetical protein
MASKRTSFNLFLTGNIAAAFAPGVFWLPSLPGQGASPWLVPLSPILLLMFSLDTDNPLACGAVLLTFLLLVACLTFLSQRFPSARIIVPTALFVLSLMQGLLVAAIVRGIDAIGQS